MNYKYSIVIPVYNGAKTIEELFDRIKKTFELTGNAFEVVFIEDGGMDNSWDVIDVLKKKFPNDIIAIKLARNFGQHNAILCGIHFVSGDFIITIDDDLQIPPEEIPKLIKAQAETGAELVYGVYEAKQHGFMRNLGSRMIQRILKMAFDAKGPITSFRLISSSLYERIKSHKQSFIYIEGLFLWHTQHIARVVVDHKSRRIGESNYTFAKLLQLTINLIFNFTTFPLRIIIFIGLAFSIVSFGLGAFFIFRKIFYEVPLGYTSIIVSIYFSSSVLLLILGVMGEYLSRLYSLQNNRPQFSIKEILK